MNEVLLSQLNSIEPKDRWGEGHVVFPDGSGLAYIRLLPEIVINWARDKGEDGEGDKTTALCAAWLTRVGLIGLQMAGDDRVDVEPEYIRFHGPTPENNGILPLVPWDVTDALSKYHILIAQGVISRAELSDAEVAALLFPDGGPEGEPPTVNTPPDLELADDVTPADSTPAESTAEVASA